MQITRSALGQLDLVRHPDHFEVLVDVPGVRPEDLDATVTGDVLRIRGVRRDARGGADAVTHRFERSVRLAGDVAPDQIEARLERGVLRIVVPSAGRSRRTIPIEAPSAREHRGSGRVRRPWRRAAQAPARRLRARAREVLHRRRRPASTASA